jgi:hypothetical protein
MNCDKRLLFVTISNHVVCYKELKKECFMTEINNTSQFDPQSIPGFTPTTTIGGTQSSPLSASSIQQSELEALALLWLAGVPILVPPEMNGNSTNSSSGQVVAAAGLSIEATKHDIISKMWDSYIANIREIADRMKKEDVRRQTEDADKPGPMSSVQYFTYLMSLSGTKRADEIDGSGNGLSAQFTNTYNQWMVNPIDSGTSVAIAGVGAYPSSSFIAGSVASNPDALRLSVGADSALLGVYLSSSPVADALMAVGPTSGLPGDYQAAAALVAALLNGGALNKAAADTPISSGGKPQYDLNFAVNYAKNIMAIVTKDIGAGDPTDPQRATQNNMVRLMLSSMALNMLYRAAYGGMEGKEFAELLAGNTEDIPSQIRGLVDQLVALVNSYLPKAPASRAEMIARLREYVDSKESVDSMLETSGQFGEFLASSDVGASPA